MRLPIISASVPVTCADSFFTSLSLTTYSTVTATSSSSQRSVYLIHGSVASATSTSAQIPNPVTPLHDETPEPDFAVTDQLNTPTLPTQAPATLDTFRTPASATLFFRSTPPATSSTVQFPLSTSAQPAAVHVITSKLYTVREFVSTEPLSHAYFHAYFFVDSHFSSDSLVQDDHNAEGFHDPTPRPYLCGINGVIGSRI